MFCRLCNKLWKLLVITFEIFIAIDFFRSLQHINHALLDFSNPLVVDMDKALIDKVLLVVINH